MIKFQDYILWGLGLIMAFLTFIYRKWTTMQKEIDAIHTYNAVNTSQHKDFKEDIKEVNRKLDTILEHLMK